MLSPTMTMAVECYVEAMVILATDPELRDRRILRCAQMVFLTHRFSRAIPPQAAHEVRQPLPGSHLDNMLEGMPPPHTINQMFLATTVTIAREVTFMSPRNPDWASHYHNLVAAVQWFLRVAGLQNLVPERLREWEPDSSSDDEAEGAGAVVPLEPLEPEPLVDDAMWTFQGELRKKHFMDSHWPENGEVALALAPVIMENLYHF